MRLSNFELLRLVAMLLVLFLHCNYSVFGAVTQTDIALDTFTSFFRIFSEQACLVCVNIFVLISGWFGIKASYKGLANILFQVIFLGWLIAIMLYPLTNELPVIEMMKLTYLGSYYWFVPSYLILYVSAPVLNTFVNASDKNTVFRFLVCFFLLEFALGWLFDWEHYGLGYSAISFFGLYVLARYIRTYGNDSHYLCMNSWYYMMCYLLLTIMPSVIIYASVTQFNYNCNQLAYSSPFIIGSSVCLLLFFSKLEFQSRAVNWASASAFSMYLIQLHPSVWPRWRTFCLSIADSYTWGGQLLIIILLCVTFAFVCILIDQVRKVAWNGIVKMFNK